MDWNLRGCSRHGHATYAPDEVELAELLRAPTPAGPAWRCLRCGAFVPGEPAGSGPAAQAPVVLRGRALRGATILRVFAVERWLRALILALLGAAVLRFENAQTSLQQLFAQILPAAKPLANLLNIDLQHSPTVTRIQSLLGASHSTLTWIAVALFGYAAVQVAEGVGLWSLQRWGEYLAVVATSVFLPGRGLRAHREDHLAAGDRLPGEPAAGRLPGRDQAVVRGARRRGRVRAGTREHVAARGRGIGGIRLIG